MKKPELLCPVGGQDTLQAAILGGADAVYFGGKEFNARMNAKNFDRDSTLRAIHRCHENGVRVYLTMNTLLTDRQLPQALDFASFLYEAGCDALIVADLGLAKILHDQLPDFELHASTQMSGHNADAAAVLQQYGFSRMVAARELDRDNIAYLCKNSPIETEFFIHGAICACHSGQCLMSSMIGDRSGNRGECAQPCRLPYNNGYPISFKDLCLAGHVTELLPMGLASLKIEGRMKSPEYVYTVASIWRRLLDEERNATKNEWDRLAGIFSRSGFTDGYFTRTLSPAMLGTRTEKDKAKTEMVRTVFRNVGRKADPIVPSRSSAEIQMPALPPKEKVSFSRSARFYDPSAIPETDYFHRIYLPLDRFEPEKANGVILPPVIFDGEKKKIRELLEKAASQGAKHALVGNLGHFSLLDGLGFSIRGDFRLNLTNSFSMERFRLLEGAIVSPELNLPQLRDLRGQKEVIVYGRLPLMLLERRTGVNFLRDRRGAIFPILREGGRDLVLNSVPLYMADRQKELKEKGLFAQHFIFTTESKKEVEKILFAHQNNLPPHDPVKRIK